MIIFYALLKMKNPSLSSVGLRRQRNTRSLGHHTRTLSLDLSSWTYPLTFLLVMQQPTLTYNCCINCHGLQPINVNHFKISLVSETPSSTCLITAYCSLSFSNTSQQFGYSSCNIPISHSFSGLVPDAMLPRLDMAAAACTIKILGNCCD